MAARVADRTSPRKRSRVRTIRRRAGARWGREVRAFLEWKRSESTVGDEWLRRIRWELLREPRMLRRVRVDLPPNSARGFRADHVRRLREGLSWARATFQLHFAALRQFLRWAHNPLADRRAIWALPPGEPSHRRWLTRRQLNQLYASAQGASRVLVGLEALNGLRRVEVLRLRVRDVLFEEDSLSVRGKGTQGGKWRKIPLHPAVRRDLLGWVRGKDPEGPLLDLSRSGADLALARAVRAARFPTEIRVSHHDLRRSFGRLAHDAGMDLVQLKNLLGHASIEMSVHYVGLDAARMRDGLSKFARYLDHPERSAVRSV